MLFYAFIDFLHMFVQNNFFLTCKIVDITCIIKKNCFLPKYVNFDLNIRGNKLINKIIKKCAKHISIVLEWKSINENLLGDKSQKAICKIITGLC